MNLLRDRSLRTARQFCRSSQPCFHSSIGPTLGGLWIAVALLASCATGPISGVLFVDTPTEGASSPTAVRQGAPVLAVSATATRAASLPSSPAQGSVAAPLLGIQPVADSELVDAPLQVPTGLMQGVFASPRTLRLPMGYHIGVFAAGLAQPRGLAISPAGDLFATLIESGQVVALRDPTHVGHATDVETFATSLDHPHGIAFASGWVYVGETAEVVRLQDSTGGFHANQREVIVPSLPPCGQHTTRTVHVGPDGMLYVSIGSSCNACVEADPRRAAIVRYNLDGTGEHIFGQGMRNAVGFTFQPGTGFLWAVVNGRDYLGDDLPGEDITAVRDGDNFGWPHCYGDRVPDPQLGSLQLCATMTEPTLQIQAHSAPLGAAFYTGQQFAASDRGSLYVALHGSWNRSVPTGYKVVEVTLRDGQPTGVKDFAIGWLLSGAPWGRPVDVVMAPDGSLFVSDDTAGAVYRIWYDGKPG